MACPRHQLHVISPTLHEISGAACRHSGHPHVDCCTPQKRFAMRSCHLLKLQKDGCVGGQSQRLLAPSPCRTQTLRTRSLRIRAAALTIPSQFSKVRAQPLAGADAASADTLQKWTPPRPRQACMPVSSTRCARPSANLGAPHCTCQFLSPLLSCACTSRCRAPRDNASSPDMPKRTCVSGPERRSARRATWCSLRRRRRRRNPPAASCCRPRRSANPRQVRTDALYGSLSAEGPAK